MSPAESDNGPHWRACYLLAATCCWLMSQWQTWILQLPILPLAGYVPLPMLARQWSSFYTNPNS